MTLTRTDGRIGGLTRPPDSMSAIPDRAPAEAREYFETARGIFDGATRAAGAPIRRRLRLAGADILLCFANGALVPRLVRALAHLEVTDGDAPPDFTIRLWDGRSTGRALPPPAWRRDSYVRHGAVQGYHGPGHAALFQADAGMLSIVDLEQGEAIVYAVDGEAIPYYETAAPLRAALGPWLATRGIQIIHAAAVGIPAAGALIVGAGGSGKSTTAAACLGSPLRFLADDYCAVTSHGAPRAVSLFSTAKLRPDGLDRLPHLRDMVANADRLGAEKPTLFLNEISAGWLLRDCPIRALLVPEITGQGRTTIRPCSRAEALRRLAPNTLAQQPGADPASFRRLAALAAAVPAHALALGTRLDEIPKIILGLLEKGPL